MISATSDAAAGRRPFVALQGAVRNRGCRTAVATREDKPSLVEPARRRRPTFPFHQSQQVFVRIFKQEGRTRTLAAQRARYALQDLPDLQMVRSSPGPSCAKVTTSRRKASTASRRAN